MWPGAELNRTRQGIIYLALQTCQALIIPLRVWSLRLAITATHGCQIYTGRFRPACLHAIAVLRPFETFTARFWLLARAARAASALVVSCSVAGQRTLNLKGSDAKVQIYFISTMPLL